MASVKYLKIVGGVYSTASSTTDDISINTAVLATSLDTPLIDRAGVINVGTTAGTTVTIGRATQVTTVNSTLDAAVIDRAGTIAIGTTSGTTVSIGRATQATSVGGTLDSVGDFSVATNKLTVAAATGNTVVAGTLGAGVSTLSSVITTDLDFTGAITIGTTNSTGITVGKVGTNFQIKGNLIVDGVETLTGGTAFGTALILNPFGDATVGASSPSSALKMNYAYWDGGATATATGYSIQTVSAANTDGTGDLSFLAEDLTETMRLSTVGVLSVAQGVDRLTAGVLNFGNDVATSVNIGDAGVVTTINGTLAFATSDRAGTIDIGRVSGTTVGLSRVGQTTHVYGDLVVDGVFSGAAGSASTIILTGGTAAFTADTAGVTAGYALQISSANKVLHADAAAMATSFTIGFADVTAASTESVKPYHVGVVTPVKAGAETWAAGDVGKPVYLGSGADAGKVTLTAPTTGALMRVGYIKDHTAGTMLIAVGNPVDLG